MNSCQHCNKPTPNPKFCSQSCAGLGGKRLQKTMITKACSQCGKEFTVEAKYKIKKFCSRSCAAKHNNTVYPKRISNQKAKPCAACGAETTNPKYCTPRCRGDNKKAKTISQFLNGELSDTAVRNRTVKNYLLEQQSNACARCGMLNEWMGEPLMFILDHIDGNAGNNHPSNVRLICSNCDSQLETYKARNKGSGRAWRRVVTETMPKVAIDPDGVVD